MSNHRIKAAAQERRRHADLVRPELANRAHRIWAIMEPDQGPRPEGTESK